MIKTKILSELVNILKRYELIIEGNNIELLFNHDESDEYEVYGDKDSINIVLNNLIT